MSVDADRFAVIYHRHQRAVVGYLWRRVGNPEDAFDLASSTFATAWQCLDRVPDEPGTRHWLLVVARNNAANNRRSGARRARLILAIIADQPRDGIAADPTGDLLPEENARIIRAFRALPAAAQEVLRLVVWEGLPSETVATLLGCSRSALDNRLSRARAQLRRAYKDEEP